MPADPQRPLPHLGAPPSSGSSPAAPEDQDQVLSWELDAFPAEDEPVWEVLEYLDSLDGTEPADGEPQPTDPPGPDRCNDSAVAAAGAGFGHGGAADTMAPGPVLATLADQVWQQGLGGLDDDELIGVLAAWQRLGARAVAGLLAAVSELAARRKAEGRASGDWRAFEHTEDELAATLTMTRHGAGCVFALALGLDRLPLTRAALAGGRIDERRATVIADELAGLDDEHAAAVEALIIEKAAGQTTGQLRPAVRRAVIAADPAAAKRRKEEALKDARVEASGQPSGTATLAGRDLPPADVLAADKHLSALAQAMKKAGAEGTMDQLRARAYLHLLAGQPAETLLTPASGTAGTGSPGTGTAGTGTAGAGAPGTQGADAPDCATPGTRTAGTGAAGLGLPALRGTVNLTVPLATWLGWSQSPGYVPGFGTVDADDSRTIAALLAGDPATQWCITWTDSAGRAVAHGCAKNGPRAPGPGPGSRAGPGSGPSSGSGSGSRAGPGSGPDPGSRAGPGPGPGSGSGSGSRAGPGSGPSSGSGSGSRAGPSSGPDPGSRAGPGPGPGSGSGSGSRAGPGPGPGSGSGSGSRAGPGPGPDSRARPGSGPGPDSGRGAGPRPRPSDDFGWISAVTITELETGTCTHQRESPAYRPPLSLSHLIRIRQATCAFPGCRRPATRCDLDHTVAYHRGGRTCWCNVAPVCRCHHAAKQAPGWALTQNQPGTMIWTTPASRTYTTHPTSYPN